MTSIPATRSGIHEAHDLWSLCGQLSAGESMQAIEISRSPFRIGRRPDLELSISNVVVSGLHACVVQRGTAIYLSDYGSTNGTFVNGNKVHEDTLLRDGDWIEIGTVHLRVSLRSQPHIKSQPAHKTVEFELASQQKGSLALTELIRDRKLEPCFQTIHRLNDRSVHGYEYLARSTVEGVLTPGPMFEVAEALGREVELSMLCRELGAAHSVCLPSQQPLFLNTHPSENLLDEVVPQMAQLSERYPARELVLEIHECAIMDPRTVRYLQQALRDCGVKLAFDDFGAGVARIRELVAASADYIKFDASLIREVLTLSDSRLKLFRSIVASIRDEGVITVAEGVEDETMICACRELGFDLAQGYALSRPAIMKPAPALPTSEIRKNYNSNFSAESLMSELESALTYTPQLQE
ncbi:MAG: EAL domain-containing protein [Fuerstiella sp.]